MYWNILFFIQLENQTKAKTIFNPKLTRKIYKCINNNKTAILSKPRKRSVFFVLNIRFRVVYKLISFDTCWLNCNTLVSSYLTFEPKTI